MTPEDQRLAIAEALGWLRPNHPDAMKRKRGWTMPEKWWLCPAGVLCFAHDIPNYPKDLNAMHGAVTVKFTTPLALAEWEYRLRAVLACQRPTFEVAGYELANATAAQRCEAFLRTIGKWEE